MGQSLPRRPAPAPPDVGCCSNSGQTRARLDWSLMQIRTFPPQQNNPLFDHLVGPTEERDRKGEAERLVQALDCIRCPRAAPLARRQAREQRAFGGSPSVDMRHPISREARARYAFLKIVEGYNVIHGERWVDEVGRVRRASSSTEQTRCEKRPVRFRPGAPLSVRRCSQSSETPE